MPGIDFRKKLGLFELAGSGEERSSIRHMFAVIVPTDVLGQGRSPTDYVSRITKEAVKFRKNSTTCATKIAEIPRRLLQISAANSGFLFLSILGEEEKGNAGAAK